MARGYPKICFSGCTQTLTEKWGLNANRANLFFHFIPQIFVRIVFSTEFPKPKNPNFGYPAHHYYQDWQKVMLLQSYLRSDLFSIATQWAKKTREIKEINFTKFYFDQIPFFAISKMAKNQFLKLGKSLKLPKMQFHEKNSWFIWFHEFFCLDFWPTVI